MAITTDLIMKCNPCDPWSRARVHALFGDREWTPLEVLRLPAAQISANDRWWVVTRPDVLTTAIAQRIARWCALSVASLCDTPPVVWGQYLMTGRDTPPVVRQYLMTGRGDLRAEAWAAARETAAWATFAAAAEAAAEAAAAAAKESPPWVAVRAAAAWAAEAVARRSAWAGNGAVAARAWAEEHHCAVLAGWLDRVGVGEVLPLEISEEEYRQAELNHETSQNRDPDGFPAPARGLRLGDKVIQLRNAYDLGKG